MFWRPRLQLVNRRRWRDNVHRSYKGEGGSGNDGAEATLARFLF